MDRPKLEVADVLRRYGEAYRQEHGASLSIAQRRVMTAIEGLQLVFYGESFLMGSEAARIGPAPALAPVWAGAMTHH
jgi:hypothetical protein